jgi:hypothetical protein
VPVRALALLLIAAAAAPARADSGDVEVTYGASLGWQMRRDFGGSTRPAFAPELWAGIYVPSTFDRLYWRPAIRAGYVGLEQAEMPGAISIEERDAVAAAELGLVYDGVVIPAVAIGAGPVVRFLTLDTDEPIRSGADPISGTEVLGRMYVQVGLGLPMFGGHLVVEPSARIQHVFGDDRIRLRLAADLSLSF